MSSTADALLAPESDLWRAILPGVRIAIVRGASPHADFHGWEGRARAEGVLAVEALRSLDDISQSARTKRNATPLRLTAEEIAVVDEARAMLRAAIAGAAN